MKTNGVNSQYAHEFIQQIEGLLQMWEGLLGRQGARQNDVIDDHRDGLKQHLNPEKTWPDHQDVYQTLVENSLQGQAIVRDFEIVYANDSLSKITGYSLDDMQLFASAVIHSALHVEDWADAWAQLVDYLADGVLSSRLELCFPHKNGSLRWAETYAKPLNFQGHPTILITCIDITDRKQTELELYQTYSELELEVRERAEELVSANGHLQAEIIERQQIEGALRRVQAELETRVQQRTEQLANINRSLQREIAERKQAQEEIQLVHTILYEIEKSKRFEEAITITLTRVCEVVQWEVGEVWLVAGDSAELKPGPVWNKNTRLLENDRGAGSVPPGFTAKSPEAAPIGVD